MEGILAQKSPAAGQAVDAYIAPANKTTRVKAIFICNRESADTTFRLALRNLAEQIEVRHYVYYDTPLIANDTLLIDYEDISGLPLRPYDVITVQSANGLVGFTILGEEEDL